MAKGIVGKIWNIKASDKGRTATAQIEDSINYITNSEKCDLRLDDESFVQIGRELKYITNDVKTLQGFYVGGRHITDVKNATEEMLSVKEFYGKTGGRVALHGIISLAAEESDKNNAGKLMYLLDDLLQDVFPKNQVVYAVHTNTENLHIHFIANTVGLDGKKIHMDKNFMRYVFEPALNKYAIKYGFTPNEEWMKEGRKDSCSVVERKVQLIKMIDAAIEKSENFNEFLDELRKQGATVNVGKHISIKLPGMSRRMRTHQLGAGYTIESITEKIANKRKPFETIRASKCSEFTDDRENIWYKPDYLKKYKELDKEKKKEVVHLLKMGRNPWRESMQRNWQLERISRSLNMEMHVIEIINAYSSNGEIGSAKDEIVQRQKMLAKDKANIRRNLRYYRPVVELYEEMKKYEKRAYLYEFLMCEEYKEDYQKYREISIRLKNNYGKDIEEVASFIEEQEGELLCIKAQMNELSEQYRAIKKYENKALNNHADKEVTFFQAVGHSKAKEKARMYGALSTRLAYIVSGKNTDVKIRVLTTPDVIDGKVSVTTSVSVIGKDGKVIDEFVSNDMDAKTFNKKINETAATYNFRNCYVMDSEDEADRFISEHQKPEENHSKGMSL